MIWIFDLDDTLYEENSYVRSGLREVALFSNRNFLVPFAEAYRLMEQEFINQGRTNVFQKLKIWYPEVASSIEDLVDVYRNHTPNLKLYPDAEDLLNLLGGESLFLVTDGSRETQWNKIQALHLESRFNKIFVTDEFDEHAAKPGIACFEMIKNYCESDWDNMVYIGDDPHKDFISLKPLGVRTVRVNRGRFKNLALGLDFEAELTVENLENLLLKVS